MSEGSPDQHYDRIYVARQPVFSADMQIWGYELLFRNGENMQVAVITDGDQATTQVIADGFTLATQGMIGGSKALINFPRNVLVGDAPYILPPERCIVEILETVAPEAEVMDACRKLKEHGYTLALDDFVGDPGFEPLCAIADIVKVDVLQKTPQQVREIVRGLSPYPALLLAEKVENKLMFDACRAMGFTYFQGYFFSKPEIIPGRKLSASQTTKIKLLRELNDFDTETTKLVDIVKTDLSISYRLLQYINSARFGLRTKIESIERAANMLGRQNLRQWLQIIIMSDMNTTDKAQELIRISVQRGRLLQLLCEQHPMPFDPDSMFLLGFFSVLDAVLDQLMVDILSDIPIAPAIKSALTDPDDSNGIWLRILEDMDRCSWASLVGRCDRIGLSIRQLSSLALEAASWTDDMLCGGL